MSLIRLLNVHRPLAPQLKLAAVAPVLSMYTIHLSLHFDLITCYTNFLQMFSLYRDPKGEHVIPTSLATTSDVKRTMKRSKQTADQSDNEATINMYKNRVQELEDQVARVRTN